MRANLLRDSRGLVARYRVAGEGGAGRVPACSCFPSPVLCLFPRLTIACHSRPRESPRSVAPRPPFPSLQWRDPYSCTTLRHAAALRTHPVATCASSHVQAHIQAHGSLGVGRNLASAQGAHGPGGRTGAHRPDPAWRSIGGMLWKKNNQSTAHQVFFPAKSACVLATPHATLPGFGECAGPCVVVV